MSIFKIYLTIVLIFEILLHLLFIQFTQCLIVIIVKFKTYTDCVFTKFTHYSEVNHKILYNALGAQGLNKALKLDLVLTDWHTRFYLFARCYLQRVTTLSQNEKNCIYCRAKHICGISISHYTTVTFFV